MADFEKIVEKVVSQVLEAHVPQLKRELVHRVLEEIKPQLAKGPATAPASGSGPAELLKAIQAVQAGSNQKEILRALLDGTVGYSGRAALFVVKAGTATGWQRRAFSNNDDVKDFSLDVTDGLAARALQSRTPAAGSTAEIDEKFISEFRAPADGHAIVLPLLLKDKVAALVYADGGKGSDHPLDAAALELLVAATSAWLEVASLRKQAAKEALAEPAQERSEAPPPVQSVASFSDPFASHAPKHTAADVAVEEAPVAAPAMAMEAAASAGSSAPAAPQMSAEDADTHRKAQRFARLLVDEIKLYNHVKVSEGRKNRDLYDRLKEDIEKSRSTYTKRYGNTAAASGDYFSQEVVRSLAEDDTSIMGANFRR